MLDMMTLMFYIMIAVLVIVVIIIVVYADKKAKDKKSGNTHDFDNEAKTKYCLHCKMPMKASDKVCMSCGEPAEGYVRCEYCGHINKAENALCEKCNGYL